MSKEPIEPSAIKLSSAERIAIDKKIGNIVLFKKSSQKFWKDKYNEFTSKLEKEKFGAVIFDYDGTLCSPEERSTYPSNEIAEKMNELIENKIIIGIATGRGKSVRTALQKVIKKDLWDYVIVGYYNCGFIRKLNDSSKLFNSISTNSVLENMEKQIKSYPQFNQLAYTKLREKQLSIMPYEIQDWLTIKRIIASSLSKVNSNEVKFVESDHTFDFIVGDVSKLNILQEIVAHYSFNKMNSSILCVGDKGEWPGNDHELLNTPFSLSVDSVSIDPETCWNLAPLGHKGTQATSYYLNNLTIKNSFFKYG